MLVISSLRSCIDVTSKISSSVPIAGTWDTTASLVEHHHFEAAYHLKMLEMPCSMFHDLRATGLVPIFLNVAIGVDTIDSEIGPSIATDFQCCGQRITVISVWCC